jgi:hypothetical protein
MASIPRLRGGQALSSYNSPPAVPEDGGREAQAPPYSQPSVISEQFAWLTLLALDSDELFDHYCHAFALRPNRYERDGCAVAGCLLRGGWSAWLRAMLWASISRRLSLIGSRLWRGAKARIFGPR